MRAFLDISQALPSPEDYGEKKRDEPVPINDDVERVRRYVLNSVNSACQISPFLQSASRFPVYECGFYPTLWMP